MISDVVSCGGESRKGLKVFEFKSNGLLSNLDLGIRHLSRTQMWEFGKLGSALVDQRLKSWVSVENCFSWLRQAAARWHFVCGLEISLLFCLRWHVLLVRGWQGHWNRRVPPVCILHVPGLDSL